MWLGEARARGGTRHTWHKRKPIPIIIHHQFYVGGLLAQPNGQPILAQPNFHTLNKSGQCSPKHKLVSDFFV